MNVKLLECWKFYKTLFDTYFKTKPHTRCCINHGKSINMPRISIYPLTTVNQFVNTL